MKKDRELKSERKNKKSDKVRARKKENEKMQVRKIERIKTFG